MSAFRAGPRALGSGTVRHAATLARSTMVRQTLRRGILADGYRPKSERLTTARGDGLQMSDV